MVNVYIFILRKVKSDGEVQVADKKLSRQLCVYFLPQSFAVSDLFTKKANEVPRGRTKADKNKKDERDRDDNQHHFQQQQQKNRAPPPQAVIFKSN